MPVLRQCREFVTLDRKTHGIEHAVGQHIVRFGIDTHRSHVATATDHSSPEARAVRQAADNAVGPRGLALLPLENRDRRLSEFF
nr:hypothetical protein CPGR_05740 [Mycolicibacter nonchromogenicus]